MDDDRPITVSIIWERKDKDGKTTVSRARETFTEIISACWKNLRIVGRIIANDGKTITAQGVCYDLESNVAYFIEVKRSILTSKGYNPFVIWQEVGMQRLAIAQRNAICASCRRY